MIEKGDVSNNQDSPTSAGNVKKIHNASTQLRQRCRNLPRIQLVNWYVIHYYLSRHRPRTNMKRRNLSKVDDFRTKKVDIGSVSTPFRFPMMLSRRLGDPVLRRDRHESG